MRKVREVCVFILLVVFAGSMNLEARNACPSDIAATFKRVSPSVVTITATSLNPFTLNDRIRVSMGSGFIIDSKGYILTNAHVVFGAQVLVVQLNSGSSLKASLVGVDLLIDLAVLKLDSPPEKLQALSLAPESALVVGEEVLAIGNPLGLEQTITRGIISGLNRVLPISPMSYTVPMIQTDASINPGNSGGPLINFCGEVLGINTAGILGAENVGFAVPATIIRSAYPQLLANGRIIRPWVGINGKMIRAAGINHFLNIPLVDGFLIEAINPGSPAEISGLVGGDLPIKVLTEEILFGGDIITSINGLSLDNPENYMEIIKKLTVGDKLKMEVFRRGTRLKVELKTVERPVLPWDLPGSN